MEYIYKNKDNTKTKITIEEGIATYSKIDIDEYIKYKTTDGQKFIDSFYKILDNKTIAKIEKLENKKEVARKLFLSLKKINYNTYVLLNDNNFISIVYAKNDEEAKQKFDKYIKTKTI